MDLFKIGSNIASMQALNSLYKLNSKLSVHQERLSTGKRVNSAQDDTTAFSVAKNVETTKQGHERALQNIKNAKSILSIAEAAQHKQLELLQKLKNKYLQGQDQTLNVQQKKQYGIPYKQSIKKLWILVKIPNLMEDYLKKM